MSNFDGCQIPPVPGCPYQTEDGFNDRNRFPHGHFFVGEIENGKRYPFGTYSKEEADAKFAAKSTETAVAAVAAELNTKANESECVEIRARLDALEYKGIAITSFFASPAICELGSTNTINLVWTTNKAPTSQNINGAAVVGTSAQYTDITTPTSFTLNVADEGSAATNTVTIDFANEIYYGAAPNLNSVTELSPILSNEKTRTFIATAGENDYIIYAIPARLGEVVFYVGGFEGGFEDADEQLLANGSGYEELYRVYRSTNKNLGTTVVEVKEAE